MKPGFYSQKNLQDFYTIQELDENIVEALNKLDITKEEDPYLIHVGNFCTYYKTHGVHCGAITYETFLRGYKIWNPEIDAEKELTRVVNGLTPKEVGGEWVVEYDQWDRNTTILDKDFKFKGDGNSLPYKIFRALEIDF